MDVQVECRGGRVVAVPLHLLLVFEMPRNKMSFDGAVLTKLRLSDHAAEDVQGLTEDVAAWHQGQPLPATAASPARAILMDFLSAPEGLWCAVVRCGQWQPGYPHAPELAAALRRADVCEFWRWVAVTPERFQATLNWFDEFKQHFAMPNAPQALADSRDGLIARALQLRIAGELTGRWTISFADPKTTAQYLAVSLVAGRFKESGREFPAQIPLSAQNFGRMVAALPWECAASEVVREMLTACVSYAEQQDRGAFQRACIAFGAVTADEVQWFTTIWSEN